MANMNLTKSEVSNSMYAWLYVAVKFCYKHMRLVTIFYPTCMAILLENELVNIQLM